MSGYRILLLGVIVFNTLFVQAQLAVNGDGLALKSGTIFSVEGMTLVPEHDFTLNSVVIEKHPAIINWPHHQSIQRLYRFSRPVTFSGQLSMNYLDKELNGNKAGELALAHASFTTINSADFSVHLESSVSTSEQRVTAQYSQPIQLSDLTAITPESTIPAYMELVIHNVITPNDDGINDTWKIQNIDLYPNNTVSVFDRDGKLVFRKLGYANDWNGTYNGAFLPEDSYYYVLEVDSRKGKETLKGFISIVLDNR